MSKQPKRKSYICIIAGNVAALASSIIVMYLWTVLGSRGMYADQTGTAGYTTGLELFLGASILPLVAASTILLYYGHKMSSKYKRFTQIFVVGLVAVTMLYCIINALLTT